MSTDKASKDKREASTKPGCTCSAHCEHVWGDQAADPLEHEIDRLRAEVARLKASISTPEIIDFLKGVELEAAHQRERWAATDPFKTSEDWFWTVGYLVGKALHKPEKRLHHLITAAAALFNWHRQTRGGG